MAFDQQIRYRVSLDDNEFQARLSQVRASLDATIGGYGGMGGMGFGMSPGFGMGMAGAFANRQSAFGPTSLAGGIADFGAQIRPITYTPPAIAMQPHFGMFQVQQTLRQAGLAAAFGPLGVGINEFMDRGITSARDPIPQQITMADYLSYSAQGFANRVGALGTAGAFGATNLAASMATGSLGMSAGTSLFGAGALGTVGGMAFGLAAALPVMALGSAVGDRMASNQAIQSTLASGSFRFFTGPGADPLTGRGFGRQARFDIAKSLQGMEARDLRYNLDDYQQILEAGTQMDLFSGTRDAEDFKGKFKSLVDTLKTVTTTLHTSLKEGLEAIRGFRDMGVTDPTDIRRLTMQSDLMGRVAGRTGMEMVAIGQTGAEMFRGTGISMQRGYELNTQNAAMIRTMLNTGAISRETVGQAGGELALAQQMTAGALSSFQTLQGRATLMSLFDPKTGGLIPDAMNKLAGSGAMDIYMRAAGRSPADIFKFQAMQPDIISSMSATEMQMFGVATNSALAKDISRNYGADFKDVYVTMGLQQGKSKEQIKTEMAMMDDVVAGRYANNLREQHKMQLRGAALENIRDFTSGKIVSNIFTRNVTQPLSDAFSGVGNALATGVENFSLGMQQRLTGSREIEAYMTSDDAVGAGRRSAMAVAAATMGTTAQGAVDEILRGAGEVTDVRTTMTQSATMSLMGRTDGVGALTEAAEAAFRGSRESSKIVNGVRVESFATLEAARDASRNAGERMIQIGGTGGISPRVLVVRQSELNRDVLRQKEQNVTEEQINKVKLDAGAVERAQRAKEVSLDVIAGAAGVNLVNNYGVDEDGRPISRRRGMEELSGDEVARLQAAERAIGATSGVVSGALVKGFGGDVVNRTVAQTREEAIAARNKVIAELASPAQRMAPGLTLMGVTFRSRSNELQALERVAQAAGGAEAMAAILSDPESGDALKSFRQLKGVSAEDRSTVEKLLQSQNLSKEERRERAMRLRAYSMASGQIQETVGAATKGAEVLGAGGMVGDISQQQFQALQKMAREFEGQLKTLDGMRIKLQEALGVKQ